LIIPTALILGSPPLASFAGPRPASLSRSPSQTPPITAAANAEMPENRAPTVQPSA
jgi:hypothetical protein